MQNRSPEKSQIPGEGVKTRKWRLAWEHPAILVDASVNHDFSFLIGSAQRHEELSEDDLYVLAVDLGMVVRSGSNQRMVKKTAMELCARVSCQIDECKGPRLKLVGDMIAHCLETMRDAFEFPVEVPERDAFLIQGGGFQLPS